MMRRKIGNLFSYICIGIVFYFLERENLFISDDLNYAMNHVTGKPIHNMLDALQSQCLDWFHVNGRFVVHTIVQCFCGFIGCEIFWVLNTIVFLIWLKGLVYYTQYFLGENVNFLGFLLFCSVLLVPGWSINLGYISGAINYLWAGCAYVWFINWYIRNERNQDKVGWGKGMCIAFISIIVGSLQESFCIGIAGYFVLYYMFHISRLKGKIAYMVCGFCIGTLICVMAPGNFVRLESSVVKAAGLMKFMAGFAFVITNAKTTILLFLTCVILFISKRYRHFVKLVIKKHALLLSSISINVFFIIAIAYTGDHQLYGIEHFSLLILVFIIYMRWLQHSPRAIKILTIGSYVFVTLLSIPVWLQRTSIANAYDAYMHNARNTKDGVVVATDFMKEICMKRGWVRYNFVRSQEDMSNTIWPSRYLTNGENDSLIQTILPQTPSFIVSACNENNKVAEGIYKPEDYFFYIIRCKSNESWRTVQITRKVTFLGEIRNKLQTGNPYETSEEMLSCKSCFQSGDYIYYIELDNQSFPIQRIELIQ